MSLASAYEPSFLSAYRLEIRLQRRAVGSTCLAHGELVGVVLAGQLRRLDFSVHPMDGLQLDISRLREMRERIIMRIARGIFD
jgi:hypothetical protein